ncbi:DUF6193 family natural product biosynthesis protein [Kitasatospora sp. NPDC057198]|uniref:DUF6193 family natural product biosynthesis protein n=1 Tax=Kitasatospora sp. NPDC057198 TaxID=3346046 RepID=UPI0036413EC6
MTTPSAPSDPALRYPEVAARGSLAAALRAAARGGLDGVPVRPSGSVPLLSATVGSVLPYRGLLTIDARTHERRWDVRSAEPFPGGMLLRGGTDDLAAVARAVRAWYEGDGLAEVERAAPFLRRSGRFEEPGPAPAELVESEWQRMRRAAAALELPWRDGFLALVEAAYAEPALRALHPFTSHWTLRFSTTTGPFLAHVGPGLSVDGDGVFGVGRGFGAPDLGRFATAREAVALAVRHLPSGLGPVGYGRQRAEG